MIKNCRKYNAKNRKKNNEVVNVKPPTQDADIFLMSFFVFFHLFIQKIYLPLLRNIQDFFLFYFHFFIFTCKGPAVSRLVKYIFFTSSVGRQWCCTRIGSDRICIGMGDFRIRIWILKKNSDRMGQDKKPIRTKIRRKAIKTKPRGGAFQIFQRIYDIRVTGESKRKNQPASLVKIAPIFSIIVPTGASSALYPFRFQ